MLQASWVTRAYDALLANEFRDLRLVAADGSLVPGLANLPANLRSSLSLGQDFAIVLGALAGLRLLVFCELLWVARTHRL